MISSFNQAMARTKCSLKSNVFSPFTSKNMGILSVVVLSLAGNQALAQTAPEATPAAAPAGEQEIVVTGFKGSLKSAIEAKRASDILIEAVTAEDIGRLPDVSIAEALARLPGITSQRTGGQASAINIRGLSQDLVSSTLNGREQVATSGNRVIEFDQYPSELISAAQVFKSPKASLIEGGVAGKVELKTARPLDAKETLFSVNIRGSFNDRAGDTPDAPEFGYRASASYQAQFLDNTLGIAIGYSRLVQPNVATRAVGFDFTPTGANGGAPLDLNNNGVRDFVSFGAEFIQFGGKETRDGVIGVIQYEPTSNLRFLIDGYYSQFDSDVFRRGVRLTNTQSINSPAVVQNVTIVNDAIVGARFVGGGINVENVNQDESRKDELYTVGFNTKYDIDNLKFNFDVSYSRGSSFFINQGLTARQANISNLVVDLRLNGGDLPTVNFSNNFADPTLNQFQGFFIVPQEDTDELLAFAGDVTIDVDNFFFKSFELGARYSTRDGERIVTSFNSFGLPNPVILPANLVSTGSFSGREARNGFPNFLVADIDGVFDRFIGENRVADQNFGFTQDQSFTISEDVFAAYAQANISTTAFGLPLTGNVGLRVVRTDQSSSSSVEISGRRTRISSGDKYTQFLPSANFVLKLTDNDNIRISLSRQISRARFFELRKSAGVGVDNNTGRPSGGGGNPSLRPFLANQGDIFYERYFGDAGIFTIGAFYKDLETFIIGGTIDQFDFFAANFSFPPIPPTAAVPNPPAVQRFGQFNLPINGQGGNVKGIEVAFSTTFDFLPAPFDGFGIAANYAYSESSLNVTNSLSGTARTIPLPGLSKHVANPTFFYEKAGFSTRLGLRYRSSFVAPQFGLNEQVVVNRSELVADVQLSYAFQPESALSGLTLLLQANNITDEPTRSFFGAEAQTGTIQSFGRQFFFGASYKF